MEKAFNNAGPESFLLSVPVKEPDAPPITVPGASRSHWGEGNYYRREHSNSFWVEAVVAGDIVFTQDSRIYQVKSGQIFLPHIGTNHLFRTGPAGYVLKRGMMISGRMLESLLFHTGLDKTDWIKPRRREDFMRVIGYFKACDALLKSREPGFMYDLGMIACRLLMELGLQSRRAYPEPVERALDYIHKHSFEHISDSDIARAACISIPHLHRLFKQHMSTTPCAYVAHMKMEQAKHLLKITSSPVREIANRLGYDDQAYFSAAFRKAVGVAPAAYRKKGLDK